MPVGLEKLLRVETREKLIEAVWGLRDSAYDEPQACTSLTAESFFQALAEELEHAPADDGVSMSGQVLARAVEKARSR